VPETRRNSSALNSEGWGENQDLSTARENGSRKSFVFMTWNGGEGGIRTHVPVTRQDAFEAPPLRPLRYLSVTYSAQAPSGGLRCALAVRLRRTTLRRFACLLPRRTNRAPSATSALALRLRRAPLQRSLACCHEEPLGQLHRPARSGCRYAALPFGPRLRLPRNSTRATSSTSAHKSQTMLAGLSAAASAKAEALAKAGARLPVATKDHSGTFSDLRSCLLQPSRSFASAKVARRSWKNSWISARQSSSSTPPTAWIRWFNAGCSWACIADSIAPAFGSVAP
jgi:hypothetical protein